MTTHKRGPAIPNGGYVRWGQLATLLLALSGIHGGIITFMWDSHVDMPTHPGAVRREELFELMNQRATQADARFDALDRKLDQLLTRSPP